MQAGERVSVACVDLDDEAAGVAEADAGELRLHVAGALPGERVTATIAHISPHARPVREAWATLEVIERPSPWRRAPVCAAFGACGGCVLQHLAYEAQLTWKRARVERALHAYASLAELRVEACVASPRPLGYRNKSKLVPARGQQGLVLGAYAPRSHAIVGLAGCRIAEPPLDATAAALAALLGRAGVAPYDERTRAGDLRHVVLRTNRQGRVLAVWISRRPLDGGEALARAFRSERPEVLGVVAHANGSTGNAIFDPRGDNVVLDGDGFLEDTVPIDSEVVHLRLSPAAFFQANRDVAGLAYATIARELAPRPSELVADVYCGVGGIALALARRAHHVVGIESHAAAVADATASAALNGITNARFVAGDAAQELAKLPRADVLVVNPPRKGCAQQVLAAAVRLAPRALAYLSCDPDTLARDLDWLAAHGHRARLVVPFDMLPHTPHVETLALLARQT